MTGPELDRIIQRGRDGILTIYEQSELAGEVEIYRAMSLRMERCVHELVKENDKAQEELKDMDIQINLRLMATNAMEKATARLDEALEAKPCL